MATFQKVPISPSTPTMIIDGTGQRVLLQLSGAWIGDTLVSSTNGIQLLGGQEFYDLGKIPIGEKIFAFSEVLNEANVLYYNTV